MVRFVFRTYNQFRQSTCTSEFLRTSIKVSHDFVLTRHSSLSFESQSVRSWSVSSRNEIETPRECEAATLRARRSSSLYSCKTNLYRIRTEVLPKQMGSFHGNCIHLFEIVVCRWFIFWPFKHFWSRYVLDSSDGYVYKLNLFRLYSKQPKI